MAVGQVRQDVLGRVLGRRRAVHLAADQQRLDRSRCAAWRRRCHPASAGQASTSRPPAQMNWFSASPTPERSGVGEAKCRFAAAASSRAVAATLAPDLDPREHQPRHERLEPQSARVAVGRRAPRVERHRRASAARPPTTTPSARRRTRRGRFRARSGTGPSAWAAPARRVGQSRPPAHSRSSCVSVTSGRYRKRPGALTASCTDRWMLRGVAPGVDLRGARARALAEEVDLAVVEQPAGVLEVVDALRDRVAVEVVTLGRQAVGAVAQRGRRTRAATPRRACRATPAAPRRTSGQSSRVELSTPR